MRGYVYLIKSNNKNWYYIGSTKDLRKRIKKHNSGSVRSTKAYSPFDLVYYEAYKDYCLARKREILLKKHGQQKEMLFEKLEIK